MIGRLKFFIKFPVHVRSTLIHNATMRKFKKGDIVFKQGDVSDDYFVVVHGSVLTKANNWELGNVTVNTRMCYDGDFFGELAHYEPSETLTKDDVIELNKQRSTCIAQEDLIVLEIDKVMSSMIVNAGM